MVSELQVCIVKGYVTDLDAKALDVIQTVNETLDITSMSELSGRDVLLKECTVGVIIGRVAIDPPVEE
jgi:hypothetical protein